MRSISFIGTGNLKSWNNQQHNDFVLGARELMNEHLKVGFVAFLHRQDYQRCYRAQPKPKKPPEDSMYAVLFRACVNLALEAVSQQLNGDVQDEVVDFVLEEGGRNSRQLYQRLKFDPLADPMLRKMLGDLTFAKKRKSPGCQAADLMLYQATRQERQEHGSVSSLNDHSSFADVTQPVDAEDLPSYRIPVTRDVLASLRQNMFAEAEIRREWWENRRNRK